jgi:hypothetical protein
MLGQIRVPGSQLQTLVYPMDCLQPYQQSPNQLTLGIYNYQQVAHPPTSSFDILQLSTAFSHP